MNTKKKSNMKFSLASSDSQVSILQFAASVSLIALLIFAYYAITWRNFFNFRTAIDTCTKPFCDFATFYYPMGEVIFHQGQPLNGFVYSPFIAILMAVFPPFGFNTSLILWGILQASVVILYLLLFRRLVPASLRIQLLFVALALSSFPFLHNLAWGQVGIITTVSILGALFFYESGQRVVAATLLTFGISFKFFPFIFFIPFVIRRDIRFLLISIATCITFLVLVPAILLGIDDTVRYYSTLFDTYRNFDWVVSNYNSQYFPHVILRLAKAIRTNARTLLPFLRWIAYGIASINVGLVYLVQRARLQHANLWSFHILFLSIPFFLKTSWPADLVYFPFAQALLAWQLLDGKGISQRKQSPPTRAVAKFLLLTSIVISNIVFFNLVGDHFSYGFYGFIFWANLLLLVITYMELLLSALGQIHLQSTA